MSIPGTITDISGLLRDHQVVYKEADRYYFQVGKLTRTQGWILHVSITHLQAHQAWSIILPFLIQEKVTFKVIQNRQTLRLLIYGQLGYPHIGKAIRIYPETDAQAVYLAEMLIRLTASFRGPAIPTDAHLGSTVYTRYGSFEAVLCPNAYGQPERHYYDRQGKLIRDEFFIPFQMPKGISWPFNKLTPPIPKKNTRIHERNAPKLRCDESFEGRFQRQCIQDYQIKGDLGFNGAW